MISEYYYGYSVQQTAVSVGCPIEIVQLLTYNGSNVNSRAISVRYQYSIYYNL